MRDLKLVYKADTEEIALAQLDELKTKWGNTYESVIDSWYENWDKLSTYFSYTKEIRKIIYTTNALEGFNRQLRKFTKARTVFPNDDALRKSLYLATEQVIKKWMSPMSNWGVTLSKLEIMFKDRINEALAI